MMLKRILLWFGICFLSLQMFAQKDFVEDMSTKDYTYVNNIKSAILEARYSSYKSVENELSLDISNPNLNLMPVFNLNAGSGVTLSFDDLAEEDINYGYTIIHCNSDWTISQLNYSDYIEGFSDDILQDYSFSNATKHNYRHFQISFPNQMMRPLISGNYLFVVYNDNTEDLVLVKRFAINENVKGATSGNISLGMSPESRFTHHELRIQVNTNKLKNFFLPEEIKVVAQQNGRWDNAFFNIPYSRMDNNTIYYDKLNQTTFEAGSEYRAFDTRLLQMHGEGVQAIQLTEDDNIINLQTGKPKKKTFFINQIDLNGGYIVNRYNSRNSANEADYTTVNFSLESKHGRLNGDVYIMGELTDWNLDEDSKMDYHPEEQLYRKTLLLKQGYYNYSYVFVPHIKNAQASFDMFEGNFSQTSNQYRVYVYQKNNGIPTYDRLIGVLTFDFNR